MATKKTTRSIEERRAAAEQLHERLVDQVASLADSGQWQRFLNFTAAFHSYSLNNTMLIWSQHPTATRVAGYRQWEKLGRHVRRGEKAIKIFGYATKKITETDDSTGEDAEKVRAYFPILSVFDIDQTDLDEGREDDSAIAQLLTGADQHGIFDRTLEFITRRGWTVELGDTAPANGYTRSDGSKVIRVSDTLEPAQRAKTMLHEAAHALLHGEESHEEYVAHRGVKETEAESVAFVMAAMLGLDTSAYSVGYVAGWAKADVALIRSTAANVLKTIQVMAAELLDEPVAVAA